jgi:hypothetical protein
MWRYRLNRWRESGMSVQQFCVQEMLNEHNFRSWQATIKKRDEEIEWKQQMAGADKKQPDKAKFIPVTLTETTEKSLQVSNAADSTKEQRGDRQVSVEILTPSGNIIRIFSGTDVGLVRLILAAFGRVTC